MPRIHSALYSAIRPEVHWEQPFDLPRAPKKVAVFAQFAREPRISRSVAALIEELRRHDYHVLLVANALEPGPLEWPGAVPDIGVLRKPNLGYDFGSWAVGLAACPRILSADRVLFVNDSLVGPFWPIDEILANFESSEADAWGLLRSLEYEAHLQSFFFGLRGDVLRTPQLRGFWGDVGIEPDHFAIVSKYELGLSRLLHRHSFSVQAMLDARAVTAAGANATTHGWRELLRNGIPFVKRQVLRSPELAWQGDTIPDTLRREFGVDLDDWR